MIQAGIAEVSPTTKKGRGLDYPCGKPPMVRLPVKGGSGWRLGTHTSQRQLGQHAVLPLPRSAEDEGEEGEGQDDDDHEAAAIGSAAIDAALPLIPELALGLLAHCLSDAKRAAMSA